MIFAEQHAAGQPTSPGSAKAVQLNPKTGALHADRQRYHPDDRQEDRRPARRRPSPIDPYAKKKKPPKKPFKLPTMNIERRGFTGQ